MSNINLLIELLFTNPIPWFVSLCITPPNADVQWIQSAYQSRHLGWFIWNQGAIIHWYQCTVLTMVYFSGLWLLFHALPLYCYTTAYSGDMILLCIVDKYITLNFVDTLRVGYRYRLHEYIWYGVRANWTLIQWDGDNVEIFSEVLLYNWLNSNWVLEWMYVRDEKLFHRQMWRGLVFIWRFFSLWWYDLI